MTTATVRTETPTEAEITASWGRARIDHLGADDHVAEQVGAILYDVRDAMLRTLYDADRFPEGLDQAVGEELTNEAYERVAAATSEAIRTEVLAALRSVAAQYPHLRRA